MKQDSDKKLFLTSNWLRLVSANYEIDPAILENHLPKGTELESHNGKYYISLVAFRYSETRLLKVKVPFHHSFEEINLRFYVKRKIGNGQWRSEVAFTKLFFPKTALTLVAKYIYKENYETLEMRHHWHEENNQLFTSYRLKKDQWHRLEIITSKESEEITIGTSEHFFSKHYWGTSRINDKSSTLYEIEHPEWRIHKVLKGKVDFDFKLVFGTEFAHLSPAQPNSVYLYDGSFVSVFRKKVL